MGAAGAADGRRQHRQEAARHPELVRCRRRHLVRIRPVRIRSRRTATGRPLATGRLLATRCTRCSEDALEPMGTEKVWCEGCMMSWVISGNERKSADKRGSRRRGKCCRVVIVF